MTQADSRPVAPVAVLEYAPDPRPPSPWPRAVAWVAVMVCWVATGLIVASEVQTVVRSGPVLFVVGLVLLLVAGRTRQWAFLALGIGHVGICAFFVALVYSFHLTPAAATLPFSAMGVVWSVTATVATAKYSVLERLLSRRRFR